MKKVFIVFILCIISRVSLSQNKEKIYYRPLQGDKAFCFNFIGIFNLVANNIAINSGVDTITGNQLAEVRYFHRDNLAFKAGFGIGTNNRKNKNFSDSAGVKYDSDVQKSNHLYSFELGLEKHSKVVSKTTDVFFGPGVLCSIIVGKHIIRTDKITKPNGDYSLNKMETINSSSFALTFQFNVGFYWYFIKNIGLYFKRVSFVNLFYK